MRPGMKMLMMTRDREKTNGNDGNSRQNYGTSERSGYGDTRGNYSGTNNRSNYTRNEYESEMRDMDARFRGGERSDYPDYGRRTQMNYPMEDNYGESRRRDRRGRFTSEMEGGYYPPPVYRGEGGGQMNMIGFERRDEISNNYGMQAGHHQMDEMESRGGSMQMGRAGHEMKMTREMAEEWMMGLQNEDGTKGPHWSMDQAKQVMSQRGIQADPATFWAVLNMMYSDYCKVFKKHGVGDRVDFYADMASAWMNDKDGPEPTKKAAAYYEHVVNQ